jgi:hypothetical protein
MQLRLFQIIRSLLPLLLLGGMTRCTEIIELDLKTDTERLVVDAILSNQDHFFVVKLSRSVPYFATEAAPAVNHAQIEIIHERTNQILTLEEDSLFQGCYYVNARPDILIPGETIQLKISQIDLNGNGTMESYHASALVPEVVTLDSAQMRYNRTRETWQMLAYFQDPSKEDNFYQFKVSHNNFTITSRPDEIRITNDQLFNGNYVHGAWMHSIDATDQSKFADADTVALQLISVTEDYFDFIYAIHQENNTSTPLFSGPASNIPGNISGNALGIFAVTAISEYGIIFDSKIHNQ